MCQAWVYQAFFFCNQQWIIRARRHGQSALRAVCRILAEWCQTVVAKLHLRHLFTLLVWGDACASKAAFRPLGLREVLYLLPNRSGYRGYHQLGNTVTPLNSYRLLSQIN